MPTHRERGISLIVIVLIVIALAAVIAVTMWMRRGISMPPQPAQLATTQPTTAPATAPTTALTPKLPPRAYMDVVLATYPDFPTTQPLGVPVNLPEAARLVLHDPVYLDSIGQLWITRADADPTPTVIKRAAREQSHVLSEQVVFVHRSPDERGIWQPSIVVQRGSGYELISLAGKQPIGSGHDYDWGRAFSWITDKVNAFVVPTRCGVSIFRPDRRPMEVHHDFYPPANPPENMSRPQVLLDWRGLLAWMPWENGLTGSPGAARFVDDQWVMLNPDAGWPHKLLHLVPLLDGGVLQLVANDDGSVNVQLAILDPADVDENKIIALVEQLSDPDPDTRNAAFAELTRYGQGIWPILERLRDQQPPEGQMRIERLLSAKLKPTLGGMGLLPGEVQVIARSRGGAAILYSERGVVVPAPLEDDFDLVAPAWLAILPGRSISLAARDMVEDLVPGKSRIDIVSGEFIVSDDVQGPRWWLANHFSEPLLKKNELEFKHIVGQDARGRWLFRRSATDASPTLIIDPTLPSLEPRLPVWRFPVAGGSVGWTADNWPVIKSGGAWVLGEADWRPLDETKERMITELDELQVVASPESAPPSTPPDSEPGEVGSTTAPSTSPSAAPATMPSTADPSTAPSALDSATMSSTAAPSTSPSALDPATAPAAVDPSTQPSTAESTPPILIDSDGTRYYDGLESLRAVKRDGSRITWPLPPEATGSGPVWLIHAGEDRLFLFNEPGRVLRIKPTPNAAEPFKLEATFTRRIPSTDDIQRIWLDPAGRIIIAHEGDTLSILFPSGRIPPAIATKIPAAELKEAEE